VLGMKVKKICKWSNFNSDDYEKVIHALKVALNGAPLWHAEEYWKGNR
jgi:hypothetical protein